MKAKRFLHPFPIAVILSYLKLGDSVIICLWWSEVQKRSSKARIHVSAEVLVPYREEELRVLHPIKGQHEHHKKCPLA